MLHQFQNQTNTPLIPAVKLPNVFLSKENYISKSARDFFSTVSSDSKYQFEICNSSEDNFAFFASNDTSKQAAHFIQKAAAKAGEAAYEIYLLKNFGPGSISFIKDFEEKAGNAMYNLGEKSIRQLKEFLMISHYTASEAEDIWVAIQPQTVHKVNKHQPT